MHQPSADTDPAIERALEYTAERLRTPKDPQWGANYVPDVGGKLKDTVTPEGLGVDAALDLFEGTILPSCRPNDGPNMLSYVPTAPTIEARLLDVILGAVTIFGSHWEAGAGAIAAENAALRWIADLAGFPEQAGGCFVSGGSAANLSALVAARYRWRKQHGREHKHRLKIALTPDSHASLAACAHVMDVDLVQVPTEPNGRMKVGHLRQLLDADTRAPSIFAVVATGGTTSTGVVDDLSAISQACSEHDTWLHVDAAYGGAALCAPSVRPLFAGIEHAHSLTVDPHKWFFAPYDCAALLYRDPELAAAAHTQRANYLDSINRDEWNPADYAFHLSRRARGLPFWFSLAANGTDAYQAAIESTLAVAREFAQMVNDRDYLELAAEPDLSVVLFRRKGWSAEEYADWSHGLAETGIALVNPIVINGAHHARVCIVNPLTTRELLESVLESMR